MESSTDQGGKAAAGCLLYQILEDEKSAASDESEQVSTEQIFQIMEDTLSFMEEEREEESHVSKLQNDDKSSNVKQRNICCW